MKIFLTGATGYIGQSLLPRLLENNHEVHCLLRSPDNYANDEMFGRCKLHKGNIADKASLEGKIDGIDWVVHLAVLSPLNDKEKLDEEAFSKINVEGTRNILKECLKAKPKKIVCFSSTAAIGIPNVDVIDENTPCQPVTPYGKSKKKTDDLVLSFIEKHGLPVTTICFPHVYGPGETRDFEKIITLIKKGIFPQVGFSPNLYPSVYISDAVEGICLALEKGKAGEKYIIADDDPHDLRVIRRFVLENLGIDRKYYPFIPKYFGMLGSFLLETLFGFLDKVPPIRVKNIRSITSGRRISIKKAFNEMGFQPKVSLREGIQHTVNWMKEENRI